MKKPEERPIKRSDIEFHVDAWTRFERAVDVAAKTQPQHRVAKKKARKRPKKACSEKSA
jgi:hypothetical protein